MTLKQIDYILELSQTLNFNRAAENLFTSQPTLTYQVKAAEEEIGFRIFDRSGKGASLTPAGAQFCITLRNIRDELKKAIEQGQNFSARYNEDVSISLPYRSAVYCLPKAINEFSKTNPSVSITPQFAQTGGTEQFLRGEVDILFALAEDMKRVPDVKVHPLFKSRIYLITPIEDPLAKKELITMNDLQGRTLMVGGGSPPALRTVQQRVINTIPIRYFNSHDHDTTLTNIASDKGICLAPGFLNDHNNEFAWTPFDCDETIECILCTHNNDHRESVRDFINTLKNIYAENSDFMV